MRQASVRLAARARLALAGATRQLVPFLTGGEAIGALQPEFAAELRDWPQVFSFDASGVSLARGLDDPARRSARLAQVARELEGRGRISGWRGETYAVYGGAQGALLFHLERAAVRRFGLLARAAHANVTTGSGNALRMWIARRSASKPIDPGMLDNLVGGGIASGARPFDTLVKEAKEEAGIEPARAARARYVKMLLVEREVAEGLHREILYVYDLEVAPGFRPRNLDGEVAAFERVDRAGLAARVAHGGFTVDAGLVALDWLLRSARRPRPEPGWRRLALTVARSERLAAGCGPTPRGLRPLLESPIPSGEHSQ